MAWYKKLFGKKKHFADIKDPAFTHAGSARRSPRYTDREALQSYGRSPWIHAALYRIASDIALTRWTVLRILPEATAGPLKQKRMWQKGFSYRSGFSRIEIKNASNMIDANNVEEIDHPVLDLLDRPNPVQNGMEFMYSIICQVELTGNAFLKIYRDPQTKLPVHLFVVPPHLVSSTPTKDEPEYQVTMGVGVVSKVPEKDMIWIKRPNPEDPYGRGIGPIQSLASEIDLDKEVINHTLSFFHNDATPGLLIGMGEDASPEDVSEAAKNWRSKNQGTSAAHGTHFYSGKLTVNELGSPIKDLEIVPLRTHTRNAIIQSFGLPPEQLGIVENSNRSTIDAATYLYTSRVLMPRVVQIWFAIQYELMPEFKTPRNIIFSFESPVPEDKEFLLKVGQIVPETLTVNEWRELQGKAPVEGGDVMYSPTTYRNGDNDKNNNHQNRRG